MTAVEREVAPIKIEVGTTIGRYTVLSRIAGGGMAEVWLAELRGIEEFRRRVVLKTIRPHLAGRSEYVKMFITEAETAARLNHPNVVPVFDLGCVDDVYFMAMEYIPGRSLREIARRAGEPRVPAWAVLHAASEVCKGLQYVHDYTDDEGRPLGLVHCDVSPDNVIVSFSGNVTLVDFGIVERAADGDKEPDVLKGKSRYIAPERLRGLPIDRRGDIYSLGVLLYELLTGARIYDGQVPEVLVRAAQGNPRRPRSVCAAISAELERVVLRAIHPSPETRYAEAHVLEAELLAHMPPHPAPAARSHELARYVSSLFPDASDIPFDLRRSVAPSPVPRSYIRMTAPHPPVVAPRPAPTMPDAEEHLSIDLLLEDPIDAERPSAAPATLPSPAPQVLESGTHRSFPSRDDDLRGLTQPGERSADDGMWAPRSRNATLVDVFAVGAQRIIPPARGVFPSARAGRPNADLPNVPAEEPRRPETPVERQAARHFNAGLRLCRERRYGAALAEWELAASLDPACAVYRTNVKKLKARLDSER